MKRGILKIGNHGLRYITVIGLLFVMPLMLGSGCSTDADIVEEIDLFQSEGEIIGADVRNCLCHCGGYKILIEGKIYRFDEGEFPEIDLAFSTGNKRLFVMLDWELIAPDSECDATDRIKVLRIKLKEE